MTAEEVYRWPNDYELETLARDIGDLPFWVDLLRRERPVRVLEIGCGCGRLTLPLARLGAEQGFTITGIEMESAMLQRAKEHASVEPDPARRALRLIPGDARDLDSALRRRDGVSAPLFDVILMPYGVAHHLISPDDRLRAWRGARRWLRTGGLLVVDLTAPDLGRLLAGACGDTPRRLDMEAQRNGRSLLRTVATRYAPATQQETLAFEYHLSDPEGSQRDYRSDFDMHVYFPRDLITVFRMTGFAVERLTGAYSGEPFGPRSPQLIGQGRAI